jgi:hypothetical protein
MTTGVWKIIALIGLCVLLGMSPRQAQAGYYTYSTNAVYMIISNPFNGGAFVSYQTQVRATFGNYNYGPPDFTDSGLFEVDAYRYYATWVGGGIPDDPALYKATVSAGDGLGKEAWVYPPPGTTSYSGAAQVGGTALLNVGSTAQGIHTWSNTGSVDCTLGADSSAHLPGNMTIEVYVSQSGGGYGWHFGYMNAEFPANTHL